MTHMQSRLRIALGLLAAWLSGSSCPLITPDQLVASTPADGAVGVERSVWPVLEFSGEYDPAFLATFQLFCLSDGAFHPITVVPLEDLRVAVNPVEALAPDDRCWVSWWEVDDGFQFISFTTAADAPPAIALYDPRDATRTAPYPDDFHLQEDPSQRTGLRHDYPVPDGAAPRAGLFEALLHEANQLDGFSPIAHMVVELSDPVDASTLPQTPAESLDPLASVVLIDVDAESPTYGQRIPVRIDVRDDVTSFGFSSQSLLIFPSIPLEPEGQYGLVVTRRVLADPTRPLAPSEFFAAVLAEAQAGEDSEVTRARGIVEPVLLAAEEAAFPAIPRADVALALSISVRSTEPITQEILTMRRHVLAADPPTYFIDSVEPHSDPDIAAVVKGSWNPPDWRDGANLARDANGLPEVTRMQAIPFILVLPAAAELETVPLVMHQHGNPGDSNAEVLSNARRFLAEGGFAVAGFTDVLNREVSPPGPPRETRIALQVFDVLEGIQERQMLPDHWAETRGEQLAFIRFLQSLDELDVLPIGDPDGVPELDLSQPLLYHGISEGGNNLQGLAPYAPELRAAAMVVGGARLTETLIHQQAETFLLQLPLFYPSLTPTDIWVSLSLFQADYDRQDPHNHARFVYRDPFPVPLACESVEACAEPDYCDSLGNCTAQKPSVLMIEGLEDTMVPNHATDSSAWQMGELPHLVPAWRDVPFLEQVSGEVSGNIDAQTTAAFYQYVPFGLFGVPATPGCAILGEDEGHFCAQVAPESRTQRLIFFETALDPGQDAPSIIDPLSLP